MKTTKNQWEIIAISDKDLGIPTDKERPCVIINDYEEDGFALVIPLTSKNKANDFNSKQIYLDSINSFVSLDEQPIQFEINFIDYSYSLEDRISLSNSDIDKLYSILKY